MRIRKQLSLDPVIYTAARELMQKRLFTEFSAYVQELIREAWEAAHANQATGQAGLSLRDEATDYTTKPTRKPRKDKE